MTITEPTPAVAAATPTSAGFDRRAIDRAGFAREWADWHAAHEAQRASEHGFLAVTGLHWLGAEPQRIDGIPGRWSTSDAGPVVELADGETLQRDGATVSGRVELGPLAERTGVDLVHGDIVIEVARRGGNDIVRPRDPAYPLRVNHAGTPVYPPNPRWLAAGRFVAYDAPREVTVGAAVEGLEHVDAAPGEIEFELQGETFRLVAFDGKSPGDLLVLFTDATSGITTYAANRSLAVAAPDAEGRVLLDFNRAVNLPCAYTDFATCPLPPAGNRLPVGVEAGEKTPTERG
ncbi:DUF1684 domain-containing protein [Schumannella soli]|uniref:DUF1684 domain-containing protein n=1 Tax=Schumannella soli TaxID=2590779 RepID=A0A506XSS8_9MICO|nr:DUF1684 domain-containing protein [Schumannella soli]TPW75721.1 DUF1684 domain-containing protein [Schumannella soli]